MHITYHGLSCFKLTAKTAGRGSEDITIIFAPYDKNTGLRPPQGNADIVIVPHQSEMFNNIEALRGTPIVLDRPGEYSVKGVNIVGKDAPADMRGGISRGNTIIYIIDVEDMKIAYLGALGSEPTPAQMDLFNGIDILFLPIGDAEGLDGKTAETIARKIEPKVIIPMQYKTKGLSVKTIRDDSDFCSQIGNCPKIKDDKYVVKKSDLDDASMRIVMLSVV